MIGRGNHPRQPLNLVADACALIAVGLFVAAGYFTWKPLGLYFGAAIVGGIGILLLLGQRQRPP